MQVLARAHPGAVVTHGCEAVAPAASGRPTPSRAAWDVAATVADPEVPVLTIEDLGVLRRVALARRRRARRASRRRTPAAPRSTRSATTSCSRSRDAGYDDVQVDVVLAPAWTTDWMSDAGKDEARSIRHRPRPRGAGAAADPSLASA